MVIKKIILANFDVCLKSISTTFFQVIDHTNTVAVTKQKKKTVAKKSSIHPKSNKLFVFVPETCAILLLPETLMSCWHFPVL